MPYSIFGEIAVFCMRLLQGVSNQMVFLNQHKNGRQRRKCTLKWRVAVQPKMCPTPCLVVKADGPQLDGPLDEK